MVFLRGYTGLKGMVMLYSIHMQSVTKLKLTDKDPCAPKINIKEYHFKKDTFLHWVQTTFVSVVK